MKLALGTVQFGIPYGINNTNGMPEDEELNSILELAHSSGVRILDTASAYGKAEERISKFSKNKFNIITKFSGVDNRNTLNIKLESSLKKLAVPSIYGYISHNANDLIEYPTLWDELVRFKEELGTVKKIGYSLYDSDQLEKLLELGFIPDIVQLPYSLLDRKFEKYLPELKKINVEVHTRSVFLQGLYFMNPETLPTKLQSLKSTLLVIQKLCKEYNTTVGSLALNYAYKNPNIDFVVIGIDTCFQLQQNIELIKSEVDLNLIRLIDEISVINPALLNPGNWKN